MVIRIKLVIGFAVLLFTSLINFSCTKIDTTNIGGGLIPAIDNVNTFELIVPVIANNFDSVTQNKECATIYPGADHVLGTISNDPYFGSTKASLYTELKPNFFPFNFAGTATGTTRTLDSIVLVLNYKRTYGDTTIPQGVEVYEINTANPATFFKPDSSSCTAYTVKPTLLGSATYTPKNLDDSVFVLRERSANQLRIKLNTNFGQQLLAKDSSNAFLSDSAFKAFFKGFAILPVGGGNALNYFSLADTNTKLAVYYRTIKNSVIDTVVTNFRFNFFTASANNIARNRAGSEISQHVAHPPAGDDVIYIQTTPGSYAEIKIPALATLSNRIIHRAELIMDQVYSTNTLDNYFTPPNYLYLDLKDSIAGNKYRPVPCDFTAPNGQPDFATFGGFKTTIKDPVSGKPIIRYSFNLSRYVQKIVTNHRGDSTFRLRAPDYVVSGGGYFDDCGLPVFPLNFGLNQTAFGRVKLGGGNNINYRMRLRIIYSNL